MALNYARIQILERLWHVTMAAMARYVAHRDHFSSGAWWKDHVGFAVKKEAALPWNRIIDSFIKIGWVILSFSMLESGLRNLMQAVSGKKPPNDFHKVYSQLLEETGVTPNDEQKSAVRLFQLTRNTIHNNGIYSGPGEEVNFGGETFFFKTGYKVNYAAFSILFPMVDNIEELVVEMVSSNPSKTIRAIEYNPPALPGINPSPMEPCADL